MTNKRTATLGEFFEELKRDLELDPNMALERVPFEYYNGTFDSTVIREQQEEIEKLEQQVWELQEAAVDEFLREDIEKLCDMLEDLDDEDDLDEVRALAHDISCSL